MPVTGGKLGFLSAGRGLLGGAVGFVQVMRELDLGDVERQLAASVRILITGADHPRAQQMAELLFGTAALRGWSVALSPLAEVERGATDDPPDLVLLALGPDEDALPVIRRVRPDRAEELKVIAVRLLAGGSNGAAAPDDLPSNVSVLAAPAFDPPELARRVVGAALDLRPDLALPLGRRFPAFRPAVAAHLIRETSRVNGQFALVSSLPANLPVVGGLISSAADMAVLTKNQAMLVYKLAGLHGRNLNEKLALAVEIAPVIGGAFVWRSLARTLLGLLPGVVGGIPKAAVAYAGTYAVGEIARYYYRTGKRPDPETLAGIQSEAARFGVQLLSRLKRQ
jgi:uncharacterized protein (DUF697 family)